jgi:hypothetical protein
MEIITRGLRDRLQLVTDTHTATLVETSTYRCEYALIGPGLRLVETRVIRPDEPVSNRLPLMVRLRWAFPPATQNRSPHHAHN